MASYLDKVHKIPVKARLIAFGVVMVLLICAYLFWVQIPMKTQIDGLEKSLLGLNATISENENKIKKLAELRDEVKNLQKRLIVLTEQLPPESEVSGLLRQIQNLVNQSGLVLKTWKPDKRKTHASGLYEEIPIALTLAGGYHNTASFFDRVGKLTRIVNIMNIKMGPAKRSNDGSMMIDISCTAMTFSAAEKKVEATKSPTKTN